MVLMNLFSTIMKGAKRQAPSILAGFGIASMVTAIIFTAKKTPEALKAKEEAEQEKGRELTPIETVKVTIKYYIPTITFAALSGLCVWSANRISKKRYAALMTAYSITDTAFKEYREQTQNLLGERKEKEKIITGIGQKHVDDNPITEVTKVIDTGKGNSLIYEPISRNYLRSDKWRIEDQKNRINERLNRRDFVCFNEWLEALGLPYLNPSIGEKDGNEFGWGIYTTGIMEFNLVPIISNTDEPCFSIVYTIPPSDKYMDLH